MKPSVKILSLALTVTLVTSTGISITAQAATKPTPKATPKASAKVADKTTFSKKSTKTPAKKKVVKKKTTKKKTSVKYKPLPTAAPKCVPKVPKKFSGVFISTPKGDAELVCVLAEKATLLSEIQACDKKVCAVIFVAAATRCKWWEVQSIVVGRYADVLGNLQTLAKGSSARELKTIILISKEPVEDYAEILNMKAFCRNDIAIGKIPSNTFTPNPELAPSPSNSPTADPAPAASPTATAS